MDKRDSFSVFLSTKSRGIHYKDETEVVTFPLVQPITCPLSMHGSVTQLSAKVTQATLAHTWMNINSNNNVIRCLCANGGVAGHGTATVEYEIEPGNYTYSTLLDYLNGDTDYTTSMQYVIENLPEFGGNNMISTRTPCNDSSNAEMTSITQVGTIASGLFPSGFFSALATNTGAPGLVWGYDYDNFKLILECNLGDPNYQFALQGDCVEIYTQSDSASNFVGGWFALYKNSADIPLGLSKDDASVWYNPTPSDGITSFTKTLPKAIDLAGTRSIYVSTNLPTSNRDPWNGGRVGNTLACIPCTSFPSGIENYAPSEPLECIIGVKTIPFIEVSLYDDVGDLLDMQGGEWSMTIEFTWIKTQFQEDEEKLQGRKRPLALIS